MRISADKRDRAYTAYHCEATVFLDGNELKDCVTADEELGLCIIFARDTKGELKRNAKNEFVFEQKRGKVKIVMPVGAPKR